MGSLDKTVLVIEDNVLNMKLFHDLLEMGGYIVLEARSGMEGWRMAREQHPDLILMDIHLPDVSGVVGQFEIRACKMNLATLYCRYDRERSIFRQAQMSRMRAARRSSYV